MSFNDWFPPVNLAVVCFMAGQWFATRNLARDVARGVAQALVEYNDQALSAEEADDGEA